MERARSYLEQHNKNVGGLRANNNNNNWNWNSNSDKNCSELELGRFDLSSVCLLLA